VSAREARETQQAERKMTAASSSANLLYFTERGSGPPLLLIHGLMITGEMFEPVLDQFAARHRVIIPDLRGHGRSREMPPPYTIAQLAADLSRLLDDLGVASTAVLGYSNGGVVAQQFARDDPGRCSALVLACTYAFNMVTLREKIEGRLVPLFIRTLGMRRFANFILSRGLKQMGKEQAAWYAGLIGAQDDKKMLAAWRAAMEFDSRPWLGEIKCPALIVAGSKDYAVPMHHAKMLHDGIAGSRLAVMDGADHALLWFYPDDLVRVTEEFLASAS
jgi:pimeloyl-ACP methyl ester carboxylesterase